MSHLPASLATRTPRRSASHATRLSILGMAFLVATAHGVRAQNAPTTGPAPGSAPAAGAPARPPAATPATQGFPKVTTIDGTTFVASPIVVRDGKVTFKDDKPPTLPLDEVVRIVWRESGKFAAAFAGQDNYDLAARPGAESSGVQDLHFTLSGLAPNRTIQQLTFTAGQETWMLNLPAGVSEGPRRTPAASTPWPLVLQRSDATDAAEVFLEPRAADYRGKTFSIQATLEGGATLSTTVTVAATTKADLKYDALAAAQRSTDKDRAVVYLDGGDRLSGELLGLGKESAILKTRGNFEVEVPLLSARGIWLARIAPAEARELFRDLLARPGNQDTAIVLAKDGTAAAIAGVAEGLDQGKLQFAYEGETRSINRARVLGLVFAARAEPPARRGLHQVVELLSGDRLTGEWVGLTENTLELQTAWGKKVPLARTDLALVSFRNGKLVYLSDVLPVRVEETPYFDRVWSYRRDVNLAGEPIKMKGAAVAKGLAVHSRSLLTYDLGGEFDSFQATLGFDDSSGGRGRAACRVLGDGRELFAAKDVRAEDDLQTLDVKVAGVKELTLEVDFGADEDIGDRVIWGEARVLRAVKK